MEESGRTVKREKGGRWNNKTTEQEQALLQPTKKMTQGNRREKGEENTPIWN